MSVVVLIQGNYKKQERFNKNVFFTKIRFPWVPGLVMKSSGPSSNINFT